jgi:hypothetical protein
MSYGLWRYRTIAVKRIGGYEICSSPHPPQGGAIFLLNLGIPRDRSARRHEIPWALRQSVGVTILVSDSGVSLQHADIAFEIERELLRSLTPERWRSRGGGAI